MFYVSLALIVSGLTLTNHDKLFKPSQVISELKLSNQSQTVKIVSCAWS